MDLRLVGYFVAVVDHGGITKAAQSLYIAQPSLSQAIRNLERQLGVHLFDRSGRRLTLTEDGASFLVAARKILRDVEHARSKVHAVREGVTGRLELAALATLAVDPLPELASRLRREHPGILLNVIDPGGSAGVVTEVREGRAELGLTDLPVKTETLLSAPLGTQEIVLVLPPDMAADLPDPVPLRAVARIPLVMEPTDTTTRTLINDALDAAAGYIAVECAHRQAIWELVRHGAGATFLPRPLAENELKDVVVRSTVPEIRRSIGVVFRSGPLSPAALAFLELAGVSPPVATIEPARRRPGPRATTTSRRTPGRTPG
ncbi:MAG: LysR family transcriptional regulator [Haloechinothrix sp.]